MSGKSRLMKTIRRQDYYRPMLACLTDLGIDDFEIVAPTGRGHPILRFDTDCVTIRIALPTTPGGGSEAKQYIPAEIRRAVRQARKG